MGFELFVVDDDDRDIGPRAHIVSLLEQLEGWHWESPGVGRFHWPDYGPDFEETVYVGEDDPCGSLMFERPSQETTVMAAGLAATLGVSLFDTGAEGDPEVETPEATTHFTAYEVGLLRGGVMPVSTGDPHWVERMADAVRALDGTVEPASPEEIAATEQRLGVPLPALLRTWYATVGPIAVGQLNELTLEDGRLWLPDIGVSCDLTDEPTLGPDDPEPLAEYLTRNLFSEI